MLVRPSQTNADKSHLVSPVVDRKW